MSRRSEGGSSGGGLFSFQTAAADSAQAFLSADVNNACGVAENSSLKNPLNCFVKQT